MPNIITDLRNSNISPTNNFGRNNPELLKYEEETEKLKEKLLNRIDEENLKLLHEFLSSNEKYQIICEEQSFHDGFCLTTKISAEAFLSCDQILK